MRIPAVNVLALGAVLASGAAAAVPPNAESLALAHTLVQKTATGGIAAMNGLSLPIPRLMGEMGITDPRQYGVIMHEDVMAVLNDHPDSLSDIQATSYASLLSNDDMKAAIAFYDSSAGQKLVKSRFKLLQTNMAQGADLLETLKPAIAAKVQDTLKAHGWTKD
jgi:hypothetical protein